MSVLFTIHYHCVLRRIYYRIELSGICLIGMAYAYIEQGLKFLVCFCAIRVD